jgi:hypothetical protein
MIYIYILDRYVIVVVYLCIASMFLFTIYTWIILHPIGVIYWIDMI